ncbi:MAG: phage tail tip lysozyme [Lachnospiraceae bacterium]|nr:phage tail tip lysozyme [Lachnospiraceae bacterium]
MADAVTVQTDIVTEQHKESVGIFQSIRDKLDSILNHFDITNRSQTPVASNDTTNGSFPSIGTSIGSSTKSKPVDDTDDSEGGERSRVRGARSIAKDVSDIANSVHGQLNGVGSNINKIYRLLLKITGHNDDDIKGDNNKEYVGFFGKLRTMLNRPFKMITNILMSPVRLVQGAFKKIHGIFSSIASTFVSTAKGIFEGAKTIVTGIAQAGLSLLQLPVQAMKMLGTVLKNALPVAKEFLVGGIKTATTVITEGLRIGGAVLTEGVRAIGGMLRGAAEGLGILIGGALSGLGNLLSGLGLLGKEALKGLAAAGKGLFKFGANLVSGALRTGSAVVGNLLGGIFGGKGFGLFKQTMDVYVTGGTLDEVTYVASDDPDCQDRTIDNFNDKIDQIITLISNIFGPKPGALTTSQSLAGLNNMTTAELQEAGMVGEAGMIGYPSLSEDDDATTVVEESEFRRSGRRPRFGMNLHLFGYKTKKKGISEEKAAENEQLATAIATAIDSSDDADDAAAKEEEEYKTRVAAGSAETQRDEMAAEAAEAREDARHQGMMQKLENIFSVNKEHHSGWSDVFGLKKGLITLGLIAAAPLIIKAIPFIANMVKEALPFIKEVVSLVGTGIAKIGEWIGGILAALPGGFQSSGGFTGMTNNAGELAGNTTQVFTGEKEQTVINPDGSVAVETDVEGNATGVQKETVSTGGLGSRILNFIMPERAKIDTETGEAYRERDLSSVSTAVLKKMVVKNKAVRKAVGTAALTGVKTAGKAIGGAIKGVASKGMEMATNAVGKVIGQNSDDVIKTATSIVTSDNNITEFIKIAKDLITKFADEAIEFLASHGVVGNAALKVATTIKSYIGKITEKVCKPFIDKIKAWFGKLATAGATAFLADLAFGALGAIVSNPAQVFHVPKKNVDLKMQLIARFIKGLMSTSWFSAIDIICQIIYYVAGVDFIGEACVVIYNAFSTDVERETLRKYREAFDDDYEAYSQSEYDAYVKKATESGQAVMSREDFQASDLATSKQQYNEMQNPDLVQKGVNSISHGVSWVKRNTSGLWKKLKGGGTGDVDGGGFGEEDDDGDTKTKAAPPELNGMPYFSQNDPNYKDMPYDMSDGTPDTIASRGCGPTAMAMIGKAYGANTNPADLADMATRGGYSTEVGTVPKFFDDASVRMGLKSEKMKADEQNVSAALAGGTPILIQGQDEDPNSPFTGKGHYVVGTRLASGAGIAINDPRGPEYSGIYPMSKVLKGASNMWVFGNGQSIPSTEETGGFGLGANSTEMASFSLDNQVKGVTPEKVIKVAANEVGYIEKKSNSQLEDKTANPGDANYTKYNQCVGSNPQYWCAAFVCWCFEQAAGGDATKVKQLLCGSKSAACNSLMSQFKSANRFDKTPKLGDCVFFSGSRHSGANHIAIVVGVDQQKVYTIEGNTSGNAGVVDNGGEVAFKQYVLGADRILGYGHPVFDAETNYGGIVGEGQLAAAGSSSGSVTTVYSDDGSSSSSSSSGSGFMGLLSNLATGIGNIYMKAFGLPTEDTSSSGSAASIATSGAANLYATASGDAPLTGNSVEEQVWNYFTGKGFTKEATAGIMGNIYQESKFKPDMLQNGSGPAAGLFQWENYKNKSKRWANLNKLAESVGKPWTDLGTQLDFGHSEMQNEKWMWSTVDNGNKTNIKTFDEFKALKNVDDATHEFEVHFERAGKPVMETRLAMARKYYNTYKNMVPGAQNGTTNNAASNAGINVATLRAEGATKSNKTSAATSGTSSIINAAANSSLPAGMGGFGGNDEDTKALGARIGINRPSPREMYASPIRRRDSYGGFGTVTVDNDKIVELLGTIATETGGINSGVKTLNDKELPTTGNTQTNYFVGGDSQNTVNNNIKEAPAKGFPYTDDLESVGGDYSVAKKLAKSFISG